MATKVKKNLTTNINYLTPIGFKLTINLEKYGNTEYFLTNFSLPEISTGEIAVPFRNAISYQPGETRQFGTLGLRFIIDEDMNNYTEMFNWLKANTTQKLEKADMILSVMSAHNVVNKQFQFKNAFPISLSGVEFNTQSTDVEYIQSDVSFRYDEFVIIK